MAQQFKSGKEAMAYLTGTSKKTSAELNREIEDALARRRTPVAKPRAAKPRAPKTGSRAHLTPAQFIASLPPALTRRGPGSVSTGTVAKTIRTELDAAEKAGALPPGTKVSVRSDHNSINVDITRWSGAVFSKEFTEHLMDPSGTPWNPEYRHMGYEERRQDARLTADLNKALATIERIADRHNYNASDLMTDYFDVGYYLNVGAKPVESAVKTGIAMETDKEFSALLERGQTAAKALGPAATKAICGSSDLRSADKWCLERLIKTAARAGGRPVAYDKRRRGWFPVD